MKMVATKKKRKINQIGLDVGFLFEKPKQQRDNCFCKSSKFNFWEISGEI